MHDINTVLRYGYFLGDITRECVFLGTHILCISWGNTYHCNTSKSAWAHTNSFVDSLAAQGVGQAHVEKISHSKVEQWRFAIR